MASFIQSVTFWMNAFIPRDISGYTISVPKGEHAGKTMIPGPHSLASLKEAQLNVPKSMLAVGLSDCFLTDQRTFSNERNAKSRMHSEFTIHFGVYPPRMTQHHNCDWTTELDCEDGSQDCHKKGKTDDMKFSLIKNDPLSTNQRIGARGAKPQIGLVKVRMKCAASNPCAPESKFFGDIDYEGMIMLDLANRLLRFDGKVDEFPAFEAYVAINGGPGKTVFRIEPPEGNTVLSLPGSANRPVKRIITFPQN